MAYTPTADEARRLERAVELASLSEGERVFWLTAFLSVVVLSVALLTKYPTWVGALGSLAGLFVLYWRLRGCHLAGRYSGHRGLFGLSLQTHEQRAFTGLMLRQALTGHNALATRPEHDPFARWAQLRDRAQAADESD